MNNKPTNKTIPIVLSSDNNYCLQLLVTLMSIVSNRKPTTSYSFLILISDDFKEEYKSIINRILKDQKLQEAQFIAMGSSYSNAYVSAKHITTTTFYRLSLPELLNEDRCLYLDVDIVVRDDLGELFSRLKDDQMIAGVKAASYYWPPDSLKDRAERLMIDRFDSYINAGVLIMNLSLMREMNMTGRFNELLKNRWNDQDILNSACYGHIGILPLKYNSMTKYHNEKPDSYDSPSFPYLKTTYSRKEWEEACKNPVIVHYADWEKPWNDLSVSHSALWWKYLKMVDEYYPCLENSFVELTETEAENAHQDDPIYLNTLVELESIKKSLSFRIGRILTFPLRKIRDLLK